MRKDFFTTIIARGGIAGETFDINLGPAEPTIIDTLLAAGSPTNPSSLQVNAPMSLVSTGALTGPRELDVSSIEDNGRTFYLSIRNTDIETNPLTITSTTSINGVVDLEVSSINDFVFVHTTGGVWRVQAVYTPEEKSNLELELEFKADQLTNYKTFAYTGSNLTTLNIYVDNTLTDLLFTKSFSYTGSRLIQTILTRLSDGATVTRDFSYTGSRLTSVETT